jgi:hypothetical protein
MWRWISYERETRVPGHKQLLRSPGWSLSGEMEDEKSPEKWLEKRPKGAAKHVYLHTEATKGRREACLPT